MSFLVFKKKIAFETIDLQSILELGKNTQKLKKRSLEIDSFKCETTIFILALRQNFMFC